MDFENLEQAIQILTNPIANQDQEVKKQANDFLLSLVSANYTSWRSYFEYFVMTQNESTKFWLLQALWDIVKEYWNELSIEEQLSDRSHIWSQEGSFINDSNPFFDFWKVMWL